MEFDYYEAPEGKLYEKEKQYSKIVIVPKDSDVIKKYNLVDIEDIEQKENK